MASAKLSALTAATSTANDSLIYVADTTDSGSSYTGKKITKANLFSGYATLRVCMKTSTCMDPFAWLQGRQAVTQLSA